jgi:hypothetical protein
MVVAEVIPSTNRTTAIRCKFNIAGSSYTNLQQILELIARNQENLRMAEPEIPPSNLIHG